MGMTPHQTRAAQHEKGHAKVLAGAGSGKSTMLIERIANLLNNLKISHETICTVMFGADPAEKFKDRLARRIKTNQVPSVFTFHRLGSQFLIPILQKNNLIPYARLEVSEHKLKKLCITVLSRYLQTPQQQYAAVHDFMSFIDLAKGTLKESPTQVFRRFEFKPELAFFVDAFKQFEKLRQQEKVRFFSDLIYDPVLFLKNNPDHIPLVANKFAHIMVDEYQDINDIQQLMIKMIAGTRANVMAVGDDDQCIYTWRGANPNYMISEFDKDFPNPTVYELPDTFRYGHQIAMASSYLISNNKKRNNKIAVSTDRSPNTLLTLDMEIPGQASTALHIKQYMNGGSGRALSDIAVLVRAYSHAVSIEIGLLQGGIPYTVEGGAPIFEAEDIGSIVTSLHLINNSFERLTPPEKYEYASRFIKSPHIGLSFDEMKKLNGQMLTDPSGTPTYLDGMQFEVRDDYMKKRLQKRANVWRNLALRSDTNPCNAINYAMEELGVKHDIEYSSKTDEEKKTKLERFEAFIRYAEHTGMDLNEFVTHIHSLIAKSKSQKTKEISSHVLITSIHRAKGLEWPLVIMVGLTEGKFPCYKDDDELTIELLEDERRLFYVAMTRAMHQLILISPNDKRLLRHLEAGYDKPLENIQSGDGVASRFLYEINAYLCQAANQLVQGEHNLLRLVKSPQTAVNYLVRLESVNKLKAATSLAE